jgi:hypothetical protein
MRWLMVTFVLCGCLSTDLSIEHIDYPQCEDLRNTLETAPIDTNVLFAAANASTNADTLTGILTGRPEHNERQGELIAVPSRDEAEWIRTQLNSRYEVERYYRIHGESEPPKPNSEWVGYPVYPPVVSHRESPKEASHTVPESADEIDATVQGIRMFLIGVVAALALVVAYLLTSGRGKKGSWARQS